MYGEIEECAVVMDRTSTPPKSKGYGFIVFRDMDAAYAALDDPGKELLGRKLQYNLAALRDNSDLIGLPPPIPITGPGAPPEGVTPIALENRKIFIKGLSYNTTPEMLKNIFSDYGEVENAYLKLDKETGEPTGMATVVFKTALEAGEAVKKGPKDVDGRYISIQFATTGPYLRQQQVQL